MEFQPGQVVIELDSEINHVYFVVTGRIACGLFDRIGKVINHDIFGRGSVVGLFSVLLPDRSHLQVETLEPTTVVRLTLDELLHLTSKYREFQLTMFRIAANIVKQLVTVDRDLPKPAVVGVVHHSSASRSLTSRLAGRLRQLGESPCVAGDDERWKSEEGIPYRLLYENGVFVGRDEVRELLKNWASYGRLFVDLRADHSSEDLTRVMSYSDIVLWCIQPQDAAAAVQRLKTLESSAPRLREKVRIVWILEHVAPAPPYVPELDKLAARDFKTYSGEPKPNQGKLLQQGIERIVHHLRGVQIGMALGGGAARGMAHLGVLKSLEQNGIYVDMLAGTSAGAMTGTIYASGMDPEYTAQCFKRDLLPPWFFRQLPAGGYWYLLHKYRRHKFDPMLRKHLDNLHMEQLVIPMITISVDLVDGVPLMRDTGDATHNILESINLPPLSLPIIRSDQALIDGGLLNNVPANELVARGCNFVIASTVTAKLERDFMGIRSKKSSGMSKYFSTIQVVMRANMIQGYSMNEVGVKPADFVIEPDVTSFDLSEFTRADEMAAIGEQATNESIHRLKRMLSKLDPKLFGPNPIQA
ncbi:patatin-like phospholipase family protein [Singulisphaera sp. Ch08]|uniref:Patatin-like phospholipase family protein n=1 Tax=Singulisphaera sp. Ch08 TaxID=3120278 RepID=A0AAU7CEK7_9BACT